MCDPENQHVATPKKKKIKKKVLNESVQVVVRCRPLSDKEKKEKYPHIVDVWPNRGVIEVKCPEIREGADRMRSYSIYEISDTTKMYTYDGVYDENASQQELYDIAVRPLISWVFEGYNCCVFAYGQTGAGKTYTMEGTNNSQESTGIIPRTFDQVWNHINCTNNMEFLVSVSYLEIYKETIRDLLSRDVKNKLDIRETFTGEVFVQNLTTVHCTSAKEMMNIMRTGNKHRTVGATNMNEQSSRSHAIFTIIIEMCNTDQKTYKVGKLNLIDLAGSERQAKSGAVADRLLEASKINQSLSALGNVIQALAENAQYVPYRDSKLTRLLQNSLGGNSKTLMIANIGPASYNYEETLTTLRYANRTKDIKNKPIKNEDPKDAKIREYQEEIERLKVMIEERKQEETVVIKKIKKRKDQGPANYSRPSTSKDTSVTSNENIEDMLDDEREVTEKLARELIQLQSKLIKGGQNILDKIKQNQIDLDKQLAEIADRKKREVEMQQKLELDEESTVKITENYSTLSQEVDVKSTKLGRLNNKYTSIKRDTTDIREDHNRDMRDTEKLQERLIKELKLKMIIINNFIPPEQKVYIVQNARYDDNCGSWILPPPQADIAEGRPVTRNGDHQPISEYTSDIRLHPSCPARYKAEQIVTPLPDKPLRTLNVYQRPEVSPTIRAVMEAALCSEGDLIIDNETTEKRINMRTQRVMDEIQRNVALRKSTARPGSAYRFSNSDSRKK